MIKADPTEGAGVRKASVLVRLWKSVLVQACKDACAANDKSRVNIQMDRDHARAWLLSGSHDLELVCDFADVNMERVTKWARECEAEGTWKRETIGWNRTKQRI